MKFKSIVALFSVVGSLQAQEPQADGADGQAESPAPPKAQIIEEESEAPADQPAAPVADESTDADTDGDAEMTEPEQTDADDSPVVGDLDVPAEGKEPVNEGIQIQVEKSNSDSAPSLGAGEVTVTSPWPAKPLDTPPLGWKFVPAPAGVEPYRTTVQLGGGRSVNLSITPYVLIPASDGRSVIRIAEPGFRPELKHLQNETIGTILQQSTDDLELGEKQTSQAITRLQQLLSSLPQP